MSKKLHNPKSHAPAVYIPCWLIQVPANHLSYAAKITYGRLSQWANESGIVYRSAKQLSEELGTSVRSIERHLSELREAGLIGTYQKQAGGLNHFEFYHHDWMDEPINENLVYKSDKYDTPQDYAVPPTKSCGTPPTDVAVPSDRVVGTPPTDVADINKKEIKINNNKPKHTSSCAKPENLTVSEMLQDNPHDIPEELLAEWKKSRKKPITKRAFKAFNKELFAISEAGITPLDAVNKMLDKQWSTVELRFFANDIAFVQNRGNSGNFQPKEKTNDMWSRVLGGHLKRQGGVFDEQGHAVNAFGR